MLLKASAGLSFLMLCLFGFLQGGSGNDWNLNSVIKFESGGNVLCIGCVISKGTIIMDECKETIEKNLPNVTATAAAGRQVPIKHTNLGKLIRVKPDKTMAIPVAPKSIQRYETSGAAAIVEDGNIVWKRFILVPNYACKLPWEYRKEYFCAKHDGAIIDTGIGAPFFVKVADVQYVYGVQSQYVGNGLNIFKEATRF